MWMGVLLGVMFLGISFLRPSSSRCRPRRRRSSARSPRRLRPGPLGDVAFLALQVATTLILVLAANTSFADFPRLASFHARDHFLPRH